MSNESYLLLKLVHESVNTSHIHRMVIVGQNNPFRISTGPTCVHDGAYIQALGWNRLGWVVFSLVKTKASDSRSKTETKSCDGTTVVTQSG